MKLVTYITFVLFIFNIFFVIEKFEEKYKPVTLTQSAVGPVFHLVNSKLYLQEDEAERSHNELEEAIHKIYHLTSKVEDNHSLRLMNMILPELEDLKHRGEDQLLEVDAVTGVYAKMLLALSYLQIRHAFISFETDNTAEMHLSLKRAMFIVKKALILSEGSKRENEVKIYADMNSIVKSRIDQEDHVRSTLQEILTQIEGLEISFNK